VAAHRVYLGFLQGRPLPAALSFHSFYGVYCVMNILKGTHIVLGVSGGIAAYKSAELLRLLQKGGASVRVAMTQNACEFVGPLTFEALSGHEVCVDMFEKGGGSDGDIKHISWARDLGAVVIAPATANVIGKIANGVADDFLTTFVMAATCPVLVCPAMNSDMYLSRAVSRNIETLKRDGFFVMEPGEGEMACQTSGPGRLPEPPEILEALAACLSPKDFAGKRVLVTAGPTREFIDPVRFISNPSSGKMGYAVAAAAARRGAETALVSGPSALADPFHVRVERVETADEMAEAALRLMESADVIIKTAAVSDYKPVCPAGSKIKKTSATLELSLERGVDILKEMGRRKEGRFLAGFAAETEDLEKNALGKMERKNLDMIVGNLIGDSSSGFSADTNRAVLFFKDGTVRDMPLMSKEALAHAILDGVAQRIFS
jgi:phosphopantothenoylcysteine decarboxylase / phosphopantothenate---cysteine ligase